MVLHALSRIGSSYTTNGLRDMLDTEDTSQKPRIANYSLRLPPEAVGLEFFLGYNPATGLPLIGDTISHKESGRKFRVASREWQSDPNKTTIVVLILEEVKS